MSGKPTISFVTPIFNEETNLANFLRNLHEILDAHKHWNWEVILIEDGSRDNTRQVLLHETKSKYPHVHVILHEKNLGYTRSLMDGIATAQGQYIMYIGADEEFDSSELPNFINILLDEGENHSDIVLGVRWQRNAYKLSRFFLSVIYIFLLNFLFKLRINDYNWSQAWPKELLERILPLRSKSLFVLPEIIIRAHDLGYKIKEIPSNHRGRTYGKSSVNIRIMGHALLEAFAFRSYRRSKNYSASGTSGTCSSGTGFQRVLPRTGDL